jgi:hypothetical protein
LFRATERGICLLRFTHEQNKEFRYPNVLLDMQYNTSRELMAIKEYGRGVHDMVKFLLTIEDREVRQRNAEAIIEVMAILSPQMKAIEDYRQKLWDHLFLISDYQLDVDSPFPKPVKEVKQSRPEPLPYPKTKIRWNHFGKKFEDLYNRAIEEEDEEKRQGYINVLALFMKVAYSNWHKENVMDDMIKDELAQMSKGKLMYDPSIRFSDVVSTSIEGTINPIEKVVKKPFGRFQNNNNNRNNFRNNNNNNNPMNGGKKKFNKFKKKNNL